MSNLYPLWRVTYEEKIEHGVKVKPYYIEAKYGNDDNFPWMHLYTCYSLPAAQLALGRLKDLYYPRIFNFLQGNEPIMYEVNGYVYKTEMVLPEQSCIVGAYIENNVKYGDREEDIIKHDYTEDFISFYDKGHALVVGKQLFLNGELLLNFVELEDICKNIGQDIDKLDYDADLFIKFIADHYEEAEMYTCGGYTNFDIRR